MTTIKERIEADWTKLEGFVKSMELKFFGGKLHQKASHPMSGESAWVPVADGNQEAKDAAAKEVPATPVPEPSTPVPAGVTLGTGTST
jgi:hypothetical protein